MSNTTTLSAPAPGGPGRKKTPNNQLHELEIASLQCDQNYQRGLVQSHIAKIVSTFEPRVLTPPVVTRRPDGSFWIVDGQQRVEALRRLGYTHVWCQVIEVMTTADEARLFVQVNSGAKKLTAQELYKACVFRGTNVATAIEDTLNSHGLTGMFGTRNNEVKAIAKMLEAWGPATPVYKEFDLGDPEENTKFKNGLFVLEWAISAGLPMIDENKPAFKVYQGNVLGALIWICSYHRKTSLTKVQNVLKKVRNPEDMRMVVTQTTISSGGSRRNLHGARLAYWLNQESRKPFVSLTENEWRILEIEDGIDVDNDPNVLIDPSPTKPATGKGGSGSTGTGKPRGRRSRKDPDVDGQADVDPDELFEAHDEDLI